MRCGRKQWFRIRNRDDGEIADGLSHPVAVSRYGQSRPSFGFTPASRSRILAPPPDQLPLLEFAADEYEEDAADGGADQNSAD
jgi:hypothetical protein